VAIIRNVSKIAIKNEVQPLPGTKRFCANSIKNFLILVLQKDKKEYYMVKIYKNNKK
jgi:hypothetical protein